MSVFTPVSQAELVAWLEPFRVGALRDFAGIATGIENTNFYVVSSSGRYVLTLFETLDAAQLPYYLDLLDFLAAHGIPCPRPLVADGCYLRQLNGKPASLATCLPGASLEEPAPHHCAQVGTTMARMHLAGAAYPARHDNPRGAAWRAATGAGLLAHLPAAEARLLEAELAWQAAQSYESLPQGVIHADLFRDNTLFENDRLSGIVDFYSACNDAWLFDVAVAVNDWCVTPEWRLDPPRLAAFLDAYAAERPFTDGEREAWPGVLRAAALRFWLSRLHDFYFPRPGEMTYAKDPGHFRRILAEHVAHPSQLTT
ncbi:MAG: homoserine kinase [Sulfuricella sp.]|nr:homoserine kinase [Sulfuricella sp.]